MINNTIFYEVPDVMINRISNLVSILQALGVVILLYVIFSIINTMINRKRMKNIEEINSNLKDIKKLLAKKSSKKSRKK